MNNTTMTMYNITKSKKSVGPKIDNLFLILQWFSADNTKGVFIHPYSMQEQTCTKLNNIFIHLRAALFQTDGETVD